MPDADVPALHVTRVTAGDTAAPDPSLPAFYFDLGSPESYLVAERILTTLPVACEWIPIRAADLPDRRAVDTTLIEERAAERHA